jgi:hypothetical protein
MTNCPVCSRRGSEIKSIPSAFMVEALGRYFFETLPHDLAISDYSIMKCDECSLE